jgi:succinyl-diaminopimelate desuccinylase
LGQWVKEFVEEVGAKLVSVNSENPPGREWDAASFFAEKAAEHGLKARLVNHGGGRGSAVVELGWGDGPTLVFNSHLDTVPAGPVERWPYHPFEAGVVGGYLVGRGSADAKGCLTAMLAAVVSLAGVERLRGRVFLTAVADEEVGGLGSLTVFKELDRVDHVVVGEPTSLSVCVASRGRVEVAVEFSGRPAHASTPELGVNAVVAASRAAARLSVLEKGFGAGRRLLGRSTACVTMFEGGLKPNVVPDRARLVVDVRTVGETPRQVVRKISGEVRKAVGDKPFKAYITSTIPFYSVDVTAPVVKAAQKALADSRIKPVITGFRAATDLNRLARQRTLQGIIMGPGKLELAHSFREKVSVKELLKAAEVYKRLAEILLT